MASSRVIHCIVLLLIGLGMVTGGPSLAHANPVIPPASPLNLPKPDPGKIICDGQAKNHIHKWFTTVGHKKIPLRCGTWSGTKGFGVRKLVAKGRWNTWYRDMITVILRSPSCVKHEGTTWIYEGEWQYYCVPSYQFRVVVQTAKIEGTRRMRGIITAYQKFGN